MIVRGHRLRVESGGRSPPKY